MPDNRQLQKIVEELAAQLGIPPDELRQKPAITVAAMLIHLGGQARS